MWTDVSDDPDKIIIGTYGDGAAAYTRPGDPTMWQVDEFSVLASVGRQSGKTYALDEILRLGRKAGMNVVKMPPPSIQRATPMADWCSPLDDAGLRAYLAARATKIPTTVRTKYYRGSDCCRVVVCAGDTELNMVGTFVEGGEEGRAAAERAAENAAFVRLLPTSWIDLP